MSSVYAFAPAATINASAAAARQFGPQCPGNRRGPQISSRPVMIVRWQLQAATVMTDATQILLQIELGDPSASQQLLPLVYDELRKLAAARLAHEKPGQTLQPTALVHEAFVRLVDSAASRQWDSRGHFFAAAAEAMRRILVENARHKRTRRAGGNWQRVELSDVTAASPQPAIDILALNEALDKLEARDPRKATLVKLRYFAGLTNQEAAAALAISSATADNDWAYAKSWLRLQLSRDSSKS
jgi:RNA polymerase sigma factor (TIGR02999 family)